MSDEPTPTETTDPDAPTEPDRNADQSADPEAERAAAETPPRVVVVTPDGIGASGRDEDDPTDAIADPAKVMRIGSMAKQLLKEVRGAPLDDAGRARAVAAHDRSIAELRDALAPAMMEELERVAAPFAAGAAPSDAELRIAQAELVGWLEGLFSGIQAALVAKQMAMQAGGSTTQPAPPTGGEKGGNRGTAKGTGQYL